MIICLPAVDTTGAHEFAFKLTSVKIEMYPFVYFFEIFTFIGKNIYFKRKFIKFAPK